MLLLNKPLHIFWLYCRVVKAVATVWPTLWSSFRGTIFYGKLRAAYWFSRLAEAVDNRTWHRVCICRKNGEKLKER